MASLEIIAQGKTKLVERISTERVRLRNQDDMTAGDGAKHDIINGKGALSTRTTSNVFKLLGACGFSTAFIEQDSPTSFIGFDLEMIKLEVVTRGLAWGSYLERNSNVQKGKKFDEPIVEFFLKTKDRRWPALGRQYPYFEDFPCDDPLMIIGPADVWLHNAHETYWKGRHFLRIWPAEAFPIPGTRELLPVIAAVNRAVYQVLDHAWALVGKKEGVSILFPDMKIEYGFDLNRNLCIGDVIDAESCRLLVDGEHASKQAYREGASLEVTKLALEAAADLSDRFADVADEVVRWTKNQFTFVSASGVPVR